MITIFCEYEVKIDLVNTKHKASFRGEESTNSWRFRRHFSSK